MTKWAVIAALSIAALAAFIEAPKIPMWGACSVGVTGTAAKLNYSGWGAEHACQEAAASSGSLYRLKGRRTDKRRDGTLRTQQGRPERERDRYGRGPRGRRAVPPGGELVTLERQYRDSWRTLAIVLWLRFGLDRHVDEPEHPWRPRTLQETAELLGTSREYVRRHEALAIRRLRKAAGARERE